MNRPLRFLNIALGLIAVLIGGALVKSWVSPSAPIPSLAAAKSSSEATSLTFNPTVRPPLAQFNVLLEKNPFKQPPPRPVGPPGPPPPPPIPPPTLVGTMLVDHERKAILSDRGKANIYSVGQEVAGGTVTDIREDRVFYKRGDAISEITLKAPIQPGAASHTQAPMPARAGAAPALVAPLPRPPGTVEGAPSR
ncbi:hypothetical protein [Candidatus Methylomirabilis sp.]|uniref:hypothetical protein n=1 Tax=Candidatus Methylomirabilis sp. TaxID=2032687 RepID=UPI002A6337B5|nr:hypothetical protein [Candidatus Methylomirabilis sp.]